MEKIKKLFQVSTEIAREKNLRILLIKLADMTKEILDTDRCSIFLNDEKTDELWTIVAHGIGEIRIPNTKGIAGEVYQTAKPLNIRDAYSSSLFNPNVDKKTGYRTRTILAIPLINRGHIIGVFQAINKNGSHFTREDEELMGYVSAYISSSVENAILDEELRKAQEEIVFRLAFATGYKDPETKNHIIRVGKFAGVVARALNWDKTKVNFLELAAPMHDIGKVGILDKILKKPGRLTDVEFDEMRKHTIFGYNILKGSDSSLLKIASKIALEHHEKWDGTGYPHGKRGEEISIEARITAIVDVFDALTSIRPYKSAWSIEDTIEEIKNMSNKHFDAYLVEVFIENLDKIIEIKNKYIDIV